MDNDNQTIDRSPITQSTVPGMPVPPAPPAPPKPVVYYVLKNGEQMGPYDMAQLKDMISRGELLKDVMVWADGMPEWKAFSEVAGTTVDVKDLAKNSALKTKDSALKAVKKMDSLVGNAAGLGTLDGFRWGAFFSAVFKKHTDEEVYEIFNCGTPFSTPSIRDISTAWPTPWLFTRMLVYGLLLTLLFYVGMTRFANEKMVPGFIFFAAMAVPFAVFIMFYELNVRRDVSMYNAIRALLGGGAASLLYALLINSKLSFLNLEGAWWAGPIEEVAKLYAALFVASFIKLRNSRILTGVLLGCATGAGFAIFETAGYIFNYLIVDLLRGDGLSVGVAIERGVFSPFCHVVWTAVTVGAFYMVSNLREKENAAKLEWKGIDWKAVADFRFLRIAIIPIILHMTWNAGAIWGPWIGYSPVIRYAIYAFLGFVAWAVALRLVQGGIHQVRQEKEKYLKEEEESAEAAEPA